LGPATRGMAHRARRARRRERRALVVDEHGLDALRADVDADDAAHHATTMSRAASLSALPRTEPASSSSRGRALPSHSAPAAISTTQATITHGNHVYALTVCST